MTRREAVRIAQAAIAGYKQALKEQAASDKAAGISWEKGWELDDQLRVLDGMRLFVAGSWNWLEGICQLDEQGRDRPVDPSQAS